MSKVPQGRAGLPLQDTVIKVAVKILVWSGSVILHRGRQLFCLRSARGLEPGLPSAVLRLQHGNQTESYCSARIQYYPIACGGAWNVTGF